MPAASAPPTDPTHSDWVLHLVPPNGGGVDRFVRELWRHRPQDRVLHVSNGQWVLEAPGHHFTALSALGPQDASALGRPAWLHAHAASPTVRAAAQALMASTRSPLALTLHDITFTEGQADEQRAQLDFMRRATLLTAPSDYLRQVVARHLDAHGVEPLDCILLPNGVAPAEAPSAPAAPLPAGVFDIAVVGAMGPHKGLQHLLEVCAALPPHRRVVLIGYADGQLAQGWKVPERLWVHGPFEPVDLPGLLRGHGARLVLFPAGQPESFCYALSDVWLAGWPVLVPDQGALGERVRRHGRGEVYDPALPPAELAQRIDQTLQRPPPAPSGPPEPSVADMVARLETHYRMTHTPTTLPPQDAELQHLAQTHLDSHFFRLELLRLQGDLDAARREAAAMRQELDTLARDHDARGQWIHKLEGDIAELQQALQAANAKHPLLRAAHRRWKALTGR